MAKIGKVLACLVLLAAVCSGQAEQWDYECSFDGERHPHEIACNRYYECRVNGAIGGWTIYLYKCPQDYKYNGTINTCTPGSCGEPVTSTTEWVTFGPSTTERPSTPEPYTTEPSTPEAYTTEPTTQEPSTQEPTTHEPSTQEPSTQEPSTQEPSTQEPSTQEPSTQEPSTQEPSTHEPSTQEPSTHEPSTHQPSSQEPSTHEPTTEAPRTTVSPGPFVCVISGYFTDTQNCSVFHHCVCNTNGCTDNVLQCPVNYHFCEEHQTCGTSSFCACTTEYRGFYY